MGSRKRKVVIICLIFVIGVILCRIISNSPVYLNWKIEGIKQELTNMLVRDELGLQEIAVSICENAKQLDDGLWHDEYRSDFPQELDVELTRILDLSPVEFDTVYVGGQTQLIYPTGCCVFRSAVKNRIGVYAWVDLVYAPSYDPHAQDWYRKSEQIIPNWYIVVLYGF